MAEFTATTAARAAPRAPSSALRWPSRCTRREKAHERQQRLRRRRRSSPDAPATSAIPSPRRTSSANTWPRGCRKWREAYSSSPRARSPRSTWCLARAAAGARVHDVVVAAPGSASSRKASPTSPADELPAVIVNMSSGRPRHGEHLTRPVGLLPGHAGRRPRRLPDHRARARRRSRRSPTSCRWPSTSPTDTGTPSMVLGDGMLGQMMEPVSFDAHRPGEASTSKDCALTGAEGRPSPHGALPALRREGRGGAQLEALQEIPSAWSRPRCASRRTLPMTRK